VRNMSEETIKKCPYCGSSDLVEDQEGYLICTQCGAIISDITFDTTYGQKPPGRTQTGTQYVKARHLIPASVVDVEEKRLISPDTSSKLKNFKTILDYCMQMLYHLGVTILDDQRKLLESYILKVLERSSKDGRQIRRTTTGALATALTHIFLRKIGKPKSLKVLQKLAIDKFRIVRNSRQISKALHFVELVLKDEVAKSRFATAEDFIYSIASELNTPSIIVRVAEAISKIAKVEKLTLGKAPNGIAAGALSVAYKYLEGRQIRSQLATIAGVSDVTIRYREMELEENPKIREFLRIVADYYRRQEYDKLHAFIDEYLEKLEKETEAETTTRPASS